MARLRCRQFFEAVQRGDTHTVREMLQIGFDPNWLSSTGASALGTSIENEQRDTTRLLLNAGADPELFDEMGGATPLMIAAEIGDESAILLLHGSGANMDCRTRGCGRTAMFSALAHREYDAVRQTPFAIVNRPPVCVTDTVCVPRAAPHYAHAHAVVLLFLGVGPDHSIAHTRSMVSV